MHGNNDKNNSSFLIRKYRGPKQGHEIFKVINQQQNVNQKSVYGKKKMKEVFDRSFVLHKMLKEFFQVEEIENNSTGNDNNLGECKKNPTFFIS